MKVGDRVRVTGEASGKEFHGETGTVRAIAGYPPIGVEFDNNINGHDGREHFKCKNGHGWYVYEHNLIEDKPAFKAGDSVKVIADGCFHNYTIGSILTLVGIPETRLCHTYKIGTRTWHVLEGEKYVAERDITLIERKVDMTKDDLKKGMTVEHRNGCKTKIERDGDIVGFNYGFSDDLKHEQDSDWDIMRVYPAPEPIWQREEKRHITAQEAIKAMGEEAPRILKEKFGSDVVIDV